MRIDLWSDFACPWCAVGVYRLDAALERFAHADEVTVAHRAFELDPHAPARRDRSLTEVVARKYGMSPAQVDAGHQRLSALGDEVGMAFHFDRVQLGSTFDAHRLAGAARGTPAEAPLVKALFGAYFTEGRLLSDRSVLLEAATTAGMDVAVAADVVDGDAETTAVRSDEAAAQQLGITGVPHFVINGAWAIPGAQDVDTMVAVLDKCWERAERDGGTAL